MCSMQECLSILMTCLHYHVGSSQCNKTRKRNKKQASTNNASRISEFCKVAGYKPGQYIKINFISIYENKYWKQNFKFTIEQKPWNYQR